MRTVMGISGAFIFPISMAVLPTIFSPRERPRAVAIGGAGMFLGLPLGPLVAGWLLTHYDWGSIFLINARFVMLALLGVWLFIPESRDTNSPRLDFIGAVLAIAGVTSHARASAGARPAAAASGVAPPETALSSFEPGPSGGR